MSAELGKNLRARGPDTPPRPESKAAPAPEHDKPKEYVPRTKQPEPTERPPDFKAGLREKVMGKKEESVADNKEAPPEKKSVVSVDDAPPPAKPTAGEEVPADHRQVMPHDKPETARRIKAILAEKTALAAEKAAIAKELEDARATAKANPTTSNVEEFSKLKEEHAKASDELLKFRRRYEIDNDDTFKKTYDEPVAHAEKSIEDTLKKYNLGDATMKVIRDEGGFAAFSRSSKTFPILQKDADGNQVTVHLTAGELARNWLNGIAVADAEFIKQSVGKQQLLSEEKKTATQRAIDESKQFFEQRETAGKQARDQAVAKEQEMSSSYKTWADSTASSTDWMKDREVPENASEEQKKKIAEDNAFNKQLRDGLNVHPKNQEEYQAVKLESAESHHLRREMGSKDAQIKSLQAELARVKGATRTTPKAGSLLSDSSKGGDEDRPKVDYNNPLKSMKENMRASMAKKNGSIEEE